MNVVVGLVAQVADHDAVDVIAGLLDHLAQQIMRQRPLGLYPVQLEHDRLRLRIADRDRQLALARMVGEQNVVFAGIAVDSD